MTSKSITPLWPFSFVNVGPLLLRYPAIPAGEHLPHNPKLRKAHYASEDYEL